MIHISDEAAFSRALDSPLDERILSLLRLRRAQLLRGLDRTLTLADLAHFIIVEPHDRLNDIDAAAGYPVVHSAAFEWVADHGGWYEAVTILSDDGFSVVLLVPEQEGVEPVLLQLLRELAEPPPQENLISAERELASTANSNPDGDPLE